MAFVGWVWKADQPLRTPEEIAREVYAVAVQRKLPDPKLAAVLDLMCIRQESDYWCPWNRRDPSSQKYEHDSESDDGRSVGYHQSQNGRPGEVLPPGDPDNWWGPMSCRMDLRCSANSFLERLSDDYTQAAGDPYRAAQFIQNVQRSYWNGDPGHPGYYGKHWHFAWSLLDRALAEGVVPIIDTEGGATPPPAPSLLRPDPRWRGDPVWLPEVLRAFGVDVYEAEGARVRGHGDFGAIPYVVWHHTGNRNETERGITHHPALGLCANLLVFPDGRTCFTGAGVAWHGGPGIYPGVPEDAINQISIGIECAHSGASGDPWPAAQMQAMINIGGAISWFLGNQCPPDHQIAHKEWAGRENPLGINKQGKPDPVDIDMRWFRGEIARRAAAGPNEGSDPLSNPDVVKMIAEIHRETVTQKSPSRAGLATDGAKVDTPLGIEWNTDGNVWDMKLTLAYLFDVPYAVEVVEHVAEHGVYPDTYAANRDDGGWLAGLTQDYAAGLVSFKQRVQAVLAALSAPQQGGDE
ncbi:lysin A [Mycobacterium phage Thonko]|uniref:Lysin A n=1 Tax=Mycobacterium phage Thonko TaxID=2282910 RepID=A0A346FC93_9CAUD|nr:endolysin [Mycobacterium phage Thonko]AXN53318.1 lysin A [Mycobacterium phage Thonko]